MANLSILAKLGVDSTSLKAGLVKAKRSVSDFAKSAGGRLLALAGVGGFGMVIRSAIAFGSTVSDLATRTGTTVEAFGALRDVSRDAGVEQSVLERGLRNVSLRAQEAADGNKDYREAIERLGLDMKTFLQLDTAAKFEAVSRAAQEAGNKSEAFADVAKILGEKAGPQLTEVLKKVADQGLGNMTDALLKSGAIMDNQTAQSLDHLEDQLQKVKDQVIISAGAFLVDMLPALKKVGAAIAGFVKENKDVLITLGKVIGVVASFKVGLIAAAAAQKALGAAMILFSGAAKKATTAMTLLNTAIRANPWGMLIAVVTSAIAAFVLFGDTVEGVTDRAVKAQKDAMEKFKAMVKSNAKVQDELNRSTDEYVKKLNDLVVAEKAATAAKKDGVSQAEATLKVEQDRITAAKKGLKAAERGLAAQERARDAILKSVKAGKEQADTSARISAFETEIAKKKNDIAKFNFEIAKGEKAIVDLAKAAKDASDARAHSLAGAKAALSDARKEFEASVNPSAKLLMDAEKLEGLKSRQAELMKKVTDNQALSVAETEELRNNELEILNLQRAIANETERQAQTLVNVVNAARQDELDMVQKLAAGHKEAAEEEERKANAAMAAAAAKEKEVAALRKDLAAAEGDLDKMRKFFTVDQGRFGGIKVNTAEMRREFKRLQKEGMLPDGVKTLRDFQKLITEQAKAAKQRRDDVLAAGRKAKADAEALRQEEKQHVEALKKHKEELNNMENKVLALREKLNVKEQKTLEQLTEARQSLEKVLAQAAKGINVNVNHAGAVAAIGVGMGGGARPTTVNVTTTSEADYNGDQATESTMKRVANAVEGKFVNI